MFFRVTLSVTHLADEEIIFHSLFPSQWTAAFQGTRHNRVKGKDVIEARAEPRRTGSPARFLPSPRRNGLGLKLFIRNKENDEFNNSA